LSLLDLNGGARWRPRTFWCIRWFAGRSCVRARANARPALSPHRSDGVAGKLALEASEPRPYNGGQVSLHGCVRRRERRFMTPTQIGPRIIYEISVWQFHPVAKHELIRMPLRRRVADVRRGCNLPGCRSGELGRRRTRLAWQAAIAIPRRC
jgi:hypothetical protein